MALIESRHWWFKGRRSILTGLLDSLALPRDATLLEVGCGTGANIQLLQGYGQLAALEPDDDARALCRRNHGLAPDEGALPDNLPYAERSFDLVAAFDVVEHIADDQAALQAIHALLKPGGHLVLTVPAFPCLWSEHDVSHHHRRRYRRCALAQRLAAAGYEVSYLSYYNSLLFPLVALARGLKALLPGKRAPDDSLPPAWLNALLYRLFAAERRPIARRWHLPFGVSLIAVATRRPTP